VLGLAIGLAIGLGLDRAGRAPCCR
jgi:hypothetical protein